MWTCNNNNLTVFRLAFFRVSRTGGGLKVPVARQWAIPKYFSSWVGRAFEKTSPQGPHSHILMTRGGGRSGQKIHILYPKRSQLQNLSTQKKSLLYLAYPPKSPHSLFSQPKKIPASFIDPKRSLLAKISDPKNHSDPPPPSPSLKYVSGAPGDIANTGMWKLGQGKTVFMCRC